jgi:rare lipoprotein A
MQSARNALRCFCTLAVSFFVLSAAPASGEPTTVESNNHDVATAASGMALAALTPATLGSKEMESERPTVPNAVSRIVLSTGHAIVGIASFYDEPQKTASGEEYDPNAYTAAAQLEIRDRFGGIKYGRLYEPAYGLGEYDGKKIIVRFNDVGPLRPGRKFDLSRAAMAYFDNALEKGLLPGFRMTPLPLGRTYPKGPVTDQQLADLGIEQDWTAAACADVLEEPVAFHTASIEPPKPPVHEAARPIQSKPPSAVHARAKAKFAAKTKGKAAAKAKVTAKANAKKIKARAKLAARIKAAAATAAPRQADQTPHPATPWVKRVASWVASKSATDTPAPASGARVTSKAVAQQAH